VVKAKKIIKINSKEKTTVKINIPEEKLVKTFINDKEIITFLCSPGSLKELAIGYLITEKIISGLEQIKEIIVDEKKGHVFITLKDCCNKEFIIEKKYLTSSRGKSVIFYSLNDIKEMNPLPVVKKININNLFKYVNQIATRIDEIGNSIRGVHKAAVLKKDKLEVIKSDVGRHNAVDKVFGHFFLNGLKLENCVLLSTGRISAEVLTKSYNIGVSTIVSLSTPTSLAIDIAEKLNVTLIGYAKNNEANIYSADERIIY
jgi:FdhD protein